LPGDDERITPLLARLRGAHVRVLVVTVDVPVPSNRDRDRRLGFSVPLRPSIGLAVDGPLHPRWLWSTFTRTLMASGIPRLPNFTADPTSGRPIISAPSPQARLQRDRFTWKHVASIRRAWDGALVLKGILSAADAREAARAGVDGLIASNDGGQLDGAVAPLEVLPELLDAAGSLPVCLDGGVRRGTDVLKALALGARMGCPDLDRLARTCLRAS
jgi:L-lactate dehydrogenase (cytochrome)